MTTVRVMIIVFAVLVSGHTQGSPDFYVASLQMPCYPPLARQAQLQGEVRVRIEVGTDGNVTIAEAPDGNPILRAASVSNVRTWKFGAGPGGDISKLKTTVDFDYRLEGDPGWARCATSVTFHSFDRVEIISHPPVPNQ
jgi:TonB family protein